MDQRRDGGDLEKKTTNKTLNRKNPKKISSTRTSSKKKKTKKKRKKPGEIEKANGNLVLTYKLMMSGGVEGGGGGGAAGPRLSRRDPIPAVCVLTVLSMERRIFFIPQMYSFLTAKKTKKIRKMKLNKKTRRFF